jgi:hypothetical protein
MWKYLAQHSVLVWVFGHNSIDYMAYLPIVIRAQRILQEPQRAFFRKVKRAYKALIKLISRRIPQAVEAGEPARIGANLFREGSLPTLARQLTSQARQEEILPQYL